MTDIILTLLHALTALALLTVIAMAFSAAFHMDDLQFLSRAISLLALILSPDAANSASPSYLPIGRYQALWQLLNIPAELSERIQSRISRKLGRSRFATITRILLGIECIARAGTHLVDAFPEASWTLLFDSLSMVAIGLVAIFADPLCTFFFGEDPHVEQH